MTAATIHADSPAALAGTVGQVATGGWFTVGQDRIAAFADATEDHQWIHLDTERAAAGPLGTTIAHGFLTLSLLPHLAASLVEVDGVSMAMNYGMDKVRFLSPVPAGARVRATTEVTAAETTGTGVRLSTLVTVEIEGGDRPALVAQTLTLYVPG
ncbi:MaoC family dehydratase [Phytomonospora endophytica]|uniref:Acyl dehydratase n=1 Tax=Phytomonospora endophytica TaxID=714109 RepID=A0A841FKY6_9ACTN|nr:MaoC family dehydratase [Phytomonospora endophytica]MBB6035583.1 acyl dehydratase [Phytomonospora endophytica]GIG70055.1 MaoC family dehydratase [Phytomonospora endophytica]